MDDSGRHGGLETKAASQHGRFVRDGHVYRGNREVGKVREQQFIDKN